ncbi:MAG: polysaccharide pyruvyl transferase family protein [Clostridium sp.]|nr:polysaccharide pyruvyl transferase family protein [Clostridium sp.]
MIIRTITCHNVDNHGANLQAYALMHYLEQLGNDVKIIDYRPDYFKHFRPFVCTTPKYASNPILKLAYICAKLPGRINSYRKYKTSARKASFDTFREKHYKLTDIYNSFDELKQNPPKADLYIAGSDQIWNTMMNNGRDPSFYLMFSTDNTVTASYAASFSVSEIEQEFKQQVSEQIKTLDYVSVREKSAMNILKDLGIHNGQVVLDPVFLLDRTDWEALSCDVSFDEKYLLVYDFEKSEAVKSNSLKYAKEHNLKIYSLYDNDYCDKSFEDFGPDMFLALIKNASFVLSNSFHATAFSLIYEKEFCVIKRQEGINSRMVDLLSSLGLQDRVVDKADSLSPIDYTTVKDALNKQIDDSKSFLNRVMRDEENM